MLDLLPSLGFLEESHQASQAWRWRCPLCEGKRSGLQPGLSSKDLTAPSTHLRRLVRIGSDHRVWSCTKPVDMLTRTYLNLEEDGIRMAFI